MKVKLPALLVVGVFLMTSTACIAIVGVDSDATAAYSVTDDRSPATTLEFDVPFDYVVSLGLGFTSAIKQIGKESKLILVDTGSKDEVSGVPTIATTDYTDVAQKIDTIKAEKGIDSKDKILIITYSYTSAAKFTALSDNGYTKVLGFYPKSYDDVANYVEKMETLLGAEHTKSNEMKDAAKAVVDKMAGYKDAKTNAVYLSYSSNAFKIANTGSIAVSMFEKCGAVNAGYDSGKSSSYVPDEGIGAFLTAKINNGALNVIFLDGNYAGTAADFIAEQSLTDKDVKVYKLEKTWNSYTPDTMDGLNYMVKCCYPSVFGNPEGDDKEPFNYTTVIIVVIAAVAVLGVAFFVMRRH